MTEHSPKSHPPDLEAVAAFHGHVCPGLLIGWRAAQLAMRLLGAPRSEDEELVAICENRSCSVDAVQVVTGCTLGKGNLFIHDNGKQVYTFARRPSGRGVRLAFRSELRDKDGGKLPREEFAALLLARPAEELFVWRELTADLPPEAEIRPTVVCAECGEGAMDTRTALVAGRRLCAECAARAGHPLPPACPI
jgi:formylmethanofuran dehydrogenase subunit E